MPKNHPLDREKTPNNNGENDEPQQSLSQTDHQADNARHGSGHGCDTSDGGGLPAWTATAP
jgi:hypothetical protein